MQKRKVGFAVLAVLVFAGVWFFWTRYAKNTPSVSSQSSLQGGFPQNTSGNWSANGTASATPSTPGAASTTRSS